MTLANLIFITKICENNNHKFLLLLGNIVCVIKYLSQLILIKF